MEVISLKCPNCSAPITYKHNSCDYCGCSYEIRGKEKFNYEPFDYKVAISGCYSYPSIGISGYFGR